MGHGTFQKRCAMSAIHAYPKAHMTADATSPQSSAPFQLPTRRTATSSGTSATQPRGAHCNGGYARKYNTPANAASAYGTSFCFRAWLSVTTPSGDSHGALTAE